MKRPADLEVSVVTPCLNPGSWLERCLDSVSAQTYPHIEHIVIDGGSSDRTVELLQKRGIPFISEPDTGQTSAINKGYKLATGELLGWLNADDTLAPRAIEATVAALRTSPFAGWTYGDCEVLRGSECDFPFRPPARVTPSTLDTRNPIPQPGSFVMRWALERVGYLDESFHLAMDYDLWLRLVDAGIPAAHVPEVVATFEIHDSSKTGSASRSDFLREESRALRKNGRHRSAAFALGRALAVDALADGSIDRAVLRDAVERQLAERADLDPGAVRAGARAEAFVLQAQRSVDGVRYFSPADLLRYSQTRARTSDAVRWGFRVGARWARAAIRPQSPRQEDD